MTALADTLEQLEREVAERVEQGKCGCGCGQTLPASRRRGSMYVDKSHGQRVYRQRLDHACLAVGQPCRLNLQLVLTSGSTSTGHGDRKNGASVAERPSKPSGLQVPYRKAVGILVDELAGVRVPRNPAAARRVIEDALSKALPARQRARLHVGRQDVGEAA